MCKVKKLLEDEDEDEENSNLFRGSHLAILYLRSFLRTAFDHQVVFVVSIARRHPRSTEHGEFAWPANLPV